MWYSSHDICRFFSLSIYIYKYVVAIYLKNMHGNSLFVLSIAVKVGFFGNNLWYIYKGC